MSGLCFHGEDPQPDQTNSPAFKRNRGSDVKEREMKTHTLKHDRHSMWSFKNSGDTWRTEAKADISYESDMTGAIGIFQKAGSKNSVIDVGGDISITGEQSAGIVSSGTKSLIKVRATSEINADYGILLGFNNTNMEIRNAGDIHGLSGITALGGAKAKIVNSGDIFAAEYGINSNATQSAIFNSGQIEAGIGVHMAADANKFTNLANGVIKAQVALLVEGKGLDEQIVIKNRGELTTTDVEASAIEIKNASVTFTNTGVINGHVVLGDGDDVFNTVNGTVNGHILGGKGNDTYVIKDSSHIITEYLGGGVDTVKVMSTYTLGNNLENLVLLGTADIDGAGNLLDNILTGNSGKNHLWGGAGEDRLDGGTGNDILTGGSSADLFHFHKGYGADTITDFTKGEDVIDLSGFAGVNAYADLLFNGKSTISGDNLIFNLGNGDMLTIIDGKFIAFAESDFIFA